MYSQRWILQIKIPFLQKPHRHTHTALRRDLSLIQVQQQKLKKCPSRQKCLLQCTAYSGLNKPACCLFFAKRFHIGLTLVYLGLVLLDHRLVCLSLSMRFFSGLFLCSSLRLLCNKTFAAVSTYVPHGKHASASPAHPRGVRFACSHTRRHS